MNIPTSATVSSVDSPLSGLLMVRQLIRVIGGTQKVDLGGTKPPSTCYQDGNIRYIPTDAMRPMINERKRVERKAASLGFRLAGSWAIPLESAQEFLSEVDAAETAFAEARATFEAEFDAACARFAADQPAEWRHLLGTRPSASQAAARCQFHVGVCSFTAPVIGVNRFEDLVASAVPALLVDIAANADEIWDKSIKGKSKVGQRTLNRVRDLVVKLESFSMLDSRVSPCVATYQTLLNALPHDGYLTPAETAEVAALLAVLSNPERVLEHGAALFSAAPGLSFDRDDENDNDIQADGDTAAAAPPGADSSDETTGEEAPATSEGYVRAVESVKQSLAQPAPKPVDEIDFATLL